MAEPEVKRVKPSESRVPWWKRKKLWRDAERIVHEEDEAKKSATPPEAGMEG